MCESEHVERMIIPPDRAFAILEGAGQAFVRKCPCRVAAKRCPEAEWEVCLLFEGASAEELKETRPISKAEALAILTATHGRNVIYNLFFRRHDRVLTEICSCCTCCCRVIRHFKPMGRYGAQLQSEYVALTDPELCQGCGACLEPCFFKARDMEEGMLRFSDKLCQGCGRCIPICPEKAIRLEKQAGRGVPIQVFGKPKNL